MTAMIDVQKYLQGGKKFLVVEDKHAIFFCYRQMLIEQSENFEKAFLSGEKVDKEIQQTIDELIDRLNYSSAKKDKAICIQGVEDLFRGLKEFQSMIEKFGPPTMSYVNHRVKAILDHLFELDK